MTDKVDLKDNALPQAEISNEALEENASCEDITVPIKYNKEVINLSLQEACELAQKGKKFEAISNEIEQLKQLASEDGQSLSQFVVSLKQQKDEKRQAFLTEKCGGDRELAQHIMQLENQAEAHSEQGFNELKAYFPQFSSTAELPQEVLENAELKGTLLLDEYLRYMLKEKIQTAEAKFRQQNSEKNSIGSQLNRRTALNPEAEEFLKGLWR